jgi:predicted transcriptional regulator
MQVSEDLTHLPPSIMSKTEAKIFDALKTMQISRCSKIEVAEHLKTCIQLSGAVPPTLPEFQFLTEFVFDNYKEFKLKELGMAFELYALDKLEVEKVFGTFSPRFLGEVMSAYKKIAVEVRKKIPQKPIETTKVYQVDEEASILEEQTWWQKSTRKDWRMINHQVYDYLWKRKVLNKHNVTPIAHEIRQKVTNYLRNKAENDTQLAAIKDDDFIRTQCKKYTLALYFDNKL